MTDQNSQFFAILTAVGEAKQANANALGVPWTFAQMGVGDANNTDPVPSRTQTKLINERRRAPLNQITVDPTNSSIIIAEQVIPPDVGGWWIREIGLYDAAGDLVAIANCAPSYKPLLAQGTGKTQVVRLNIVVTSTASVELKIDPAVVLATRAYVDASILSVLPPNKTAGTYTQVRVDGRGVVQQGFNPTTLAGYGITDAMAKGAGGLMSAPKALARLDNLDATQFFTVDMNTVGGPAQLTYGAGFHVEFPNTYYGFEFLGGVLTDWYGARHVSDAGPGPWRAFWHDGNFNPALKADKATTLSGYGITDALPNRNPLPNGNLDLHGAHVAFVSAAGQSSLFQNAYWNGSVVIKHDPAKPAVCIAGLDGKAIVVKWSADNPGGEHDGSFELLDRSMMASAAELDEGTTTQKWVSVSGLTRFFGRVVKQATESVVGILKVATQSETNAGISDIVAVTPKKLRWGFAASFGTNSYITFPTWLGGLIIQFGNSPMIIDSTVISFPIAFPNRCLSLHEHDATGAGGNIRTFWQFREVTTSGFNALNIGAYTKGATAWTGVSVSSGCAWLAIGY